MNELDRLSAASEQTNAANFHCGSSGPARHDAGQANRLLINAYTQQAITKL